MVPAYLLRGQRTGDSIQVTQAHRLVGGEVIKGIYGICRLCIIEGHDVIFPVGHCTWGARLSCSICWSYSPAGSRLLRQIRLAYIAGEVCQPDIVDGVDYTAHGHIHLLRSFLLRDIGRPVKAEVHLDIVRQP